jgi:prolyl oligopeptidase
LYQTKKIVVRRLPAARPPSRNGVLVPRIAALVCAVTFLVAAGPVAGAGSGADPFLWLEQTHGARALAWVKAENAKTLAVLQKDPRFAAFYADALRVGEATDRVPYPEIVDGRIYNFWQDSAHPRGIWRTTTPAGYAAATPVWKTVLDLDALAQTEGKNWVWQGADCDSPSRTRCLIALSDGGEDASTVREFDLPTARFVDGGFVLPHAKQTAAWESDDALIVSRAWAGTDLTSSGYPYVVKRLERGQALSDAVEVARGAPSDVSVEVEEFHDGGGRRALVARREVSFFESRWQLVTPAGVRDFALPPKCDLSALVAGRLIVDLQQRWAPNGRAFPAGSLVSLDLAAASADPSRLEPTLVYAPGPREALGNVGATRDRLVVTSYANVRGRAAVYTPAAGNAWSERHLDLPDDSTIGLVAADETGSAAFVSVTSFLTPTTLWRVNADSGVATIVKRLPVRFDATRDVVAQHEAVSKDGTRVPYFVVRPKNATFDGRNPTLIYAYGGFGLSQTPYYSGVLGKLWLERGGVYVLANIRGGGEFGPAWHDAGLKTHRQRIYDDFAAVARDLIAKRITSPRYLGIQGGSNGGLLMGVEFTQHPELWNAVDIQVPLLDMLRYEQIDAGASWTGEYGSVSVPAERAFLASISPYNNLKPGVRYPEPFVWTTTKDDRVGPQHARKFAARLQSMGIPYLFYEVTEGGHGSGANIRERSFTTALEFTYLNRKLMP